MLGFAFAMVKAQITLSNRPFIIFYLSGVYINSNLNEFAGFIVTLQKYFISVTFKMGSEQIVNDCLDYVVDNQRIFGQGVSDKCK